MSEAIKVICSAIICLLLVSIICGVNTISLAAEEQREQIEQEEKATDAEKIEAKKEAAAEAKRLAVEKTETKLEEISTEINLPEDTTQQFSVKQINISGNNLISTGQLFEDIPLVYNASDEPLRQAESEYLYDFRELKEVILNPGQPRMVSARTIQGLTQYILSVYQDNNFAGIYVYVPSGTVREGRLLDETLVIKVLEAEVTRITVTHYDPDQKKVDKGYLRTSAVEKWSPVKVGQVAKQKKLDDFVNLLNLNPDRYVSAVVTKGIEPNSIAVAYDIYEANPWHYFIQVDNAGTRDRQWSPRVGVINTNLLGVDDTLAVVYQAPWDESIDEDYSVYGSYDVPLLSPRLRLNLYAGYSEFDITPDTGGISFLGNGTFYGGGLRYNLFQTQGWFFDVTGSLSHERSEVTPSLFPGILGTDVKMDIIGYGVDLHRSNDMMETSIAFTRVDSIGGSDNDEFTMARTNADRDFAIHTLNATHSQYMDPNKVGRLSATFKWISPSERLAPAKMTTFGGLYTVRGYHEDEVVADGGVLVSVQYEYDLVKKGQSKAAEDTNPEGTKKPFVRKLAPLAFFDYGRAKIENPIFLEKAHYTLSSVGGGVALELGNNFSGAVFYGFPLEQTDDTDEGDGRLNATIMCRW